MSQILFRLTAFVTTVFVITILTLVAIMLGDPAAPINIWFNRHATTVLLTEVAAIVVLGFAAMTADRRETLRAIASRPPENRPPSDEGPISPSGNS